MKKLSLYILTSTFILASCGGGGGGGDSAPPAPIYPSVSFQSGLSVDGGTEITVAPNIRDPQSRITSREWSLSISGGKDFEYSTTNTSVTFTAPKNQTDQTVTITFSYTYRQDGTTPTTGSGSAKGEVLMKAVIPDTPANFSGNGLSQSADFAWGVSEGTASYYVYYSSGDTVTTSDSYVEIEGENTSDTFLVRIPNDITWYWAISAVNSAGESQLSSPIAITTKSPVAEFTNQPNTGSFDFTKIDQWGNELDDSVSDWSCVKDNVTGLMWEVKKDTNRTFGDDGLRDLDDKYSFYDSTNVVNGENDFGDKNVDGTDCVFAIEGIDYNCNTEDFFKSLNSQPDGEHFCGRTDWRLPTLTEVVQLVDFDEFHYKLSTDYFTGTNNIIGAYETYWTANQEEDGNSPSDQFIVTFDTDGGISNNASKTREHHVLSVSGSDDEQNEQASFIVQCFEHDNQAQYWSEEYSIVDAKELAATKSNNSGEDWRVSKIKEVIQYIDDIPRGSRILTSSDTPNGNVYDNYSVTIIGESGYYSKKGQIGIGDSYLGTYHICLSKY